MSFAAKLASPRTSTDAGAGASRLGTRRITDVGRDLAVLVGAALTIGIAAGFGMMLAVLALA